MRNDNPITLHPYPPSEPYVCSECGSEDIEIEMWVRVNETMRDDTDQEWGPICGDTSDNEVWCPNCEQHRHCVPKSEFNPSTTTPKE